MAGDRLCKVLENEVGTNLEGFRTVRASCSAAGQRWGMPERYRAEWPPRCAQRQLPPIQLPTGMPYVTYDGARR
jgi:hypothetical protein